MLTTTTIYERPDSWFIEPCEPESPDMPEAWNSHWNDEMAASPFSWLCFFESEGECLDYSTNAKTINVCAAKYQGEADYRKFSFDELTVLLMDGTNEQTLKAKAELRERAFSTKDFQKQKEQMWERHVIDCRDERENPYIF